MAAAGVTQVQGPRAKRGERVFPTRTLLLGRRARHLAADIEMVDEMRAMLGVGRKRKSAATGQQMAVADGPARVRPRSRSTEGNGA